MKNIYVMVIDQSLRRIILNFKVMHILGSLKYCITLVLKYYVESVKRMEKVIEVLGNLVTMQLRCVYGVRTKERTFQLILCMKVISCRGSNTKIKSQTCFLKISASNISILYPRRYSICHNS